MDRMKTILVTGAAGFIGANLCLKLFRKYENVHIIGIHIMMSVSRNGDWRK